MLFAGINLEPYHYDLYILILDHNGKIRIKAVWNDYDSKKNLTFSVKHLISSICIYPKIEQIIIFFDDKVLYENVNVLFTDSSNIICKHDNIDRFKFEQISDVFGLPYYACGDFIKAFNLVMMASLQSSCVMQKKLLKESN